MPEALTDLQLSERVITIEQVPVARLEASRDDVIRMANSLTVETAADIEIADAILIRLAAGIETAKLGLKPMRDSTTAAWKAGTELEKRLIGPLDAAKKTLSQRRGAAWQRIQDAAAVAASEAMDRGDFDNLPTAPMVESQGVTSRETFSAECGDLTALIKAAAKNPKVYARFLQADETSLNNEARQMKDGFDVPGCKLVKGFSSTVRTGPAKPWRDGFSKAKP